MNAPHDWHAFDVPGLAEPGPVSADPRSRLRWLLALFVLSLAVVGARIVSLEVTYGSTYRELADRPLERTIVLPAVRGRILAADGTVLACDEPLASLAVRYRWLEEPPTADWLRRVARSRLSRQQRRDPAQVAAAEEQVLVEREDLHRRLASLCGISPEQFHARIAAIQQRVERTAAHVNQRRAAQHAQASGARVAGNESSWWQRAGGELERLFSAGQDEGPPAPITLAEQLADHIVWESLSLEAVAAIGAEPWRYPGVRVVERTRRIYPSGALAAHLIGYTGSPLGGAVESADADSPRQLVGIVGIEQRYETLLAGKPGKAVEQLDHSGRQLGWRVERASQPGRDVVLALDPHLQRAAESLLDAALTVSHRTNNDESAGGAVVVLQVQSGNVLAAASAPRFDPGLAADSRQMTAWLAAAGKPLLDRSLKMAIPPGSVFKTLSAIALLETGTVLADEPFQCRGYLDRPDRQRCLIFKNRGIGHGPIDLAGALAQSCNVYFFHFATESGPGPIVDWARRLGFGQPTGIDLEGEVRGRVPSPVERIGGRPAWSAADTQALAIGQSELLVTPLQVARLMAAVANGGSMVQPRVARGLALDDSPETSLGEAETIAPGQSRRVDGLRASTLLAVRNGLEAAVASPEGTAHPSVYLESVSIAGKTGTAETGPGRADHAWLAAYAPSDAPRVAIVVALEHAGGGGEAAGPIVKRLVSEMQTLGYFGRRKLAGQPR
jgi:penicillin-binding protein 2